MSRQWPILGLVISAGLAPTTAGTVEPIPLPGCPSFKTLGVTLDQRIAGLKPGLTLQEFTKTFASQALNFEHPQSREGALFFIGVSDGNASVTDEVQCRFDRAGRLISCHRECCRSETRSVTLEQYNSLAVGQSRSDIEARLCSPSHAERASRIKLRTSYHIALPVGHHDEGQGVLLIFENDRLTFKGMSPYY